MSLRARIAALLLLVVLLAMAGSLVLHTLAARQALQQELTLRNRDAAASLAVALSQQQGDLAAMRAVAAAQFDLGAYRKLSLQLLPTADADGDPSATVESGVHGFQLSQPAIASAAPAWFVAALPLQAPAGSARVMHGWREVGTLEVESQITWAQATLWRAASSTAALLLLLAAVACALAMLALRVWLRPLQNTVKQAQALEAGRFIEATEPELPELRGLTRAMNAMVRRLREVFAAQADQVAVLQRQAQHDALTGLPLRRQFVGRLSDHLGDHLEERPGGLAGGHAGGHAGGLAGGRPAGSPAGQGPGVALILLRVQHLEALNDRLGHDTTDNLLSTISALLEAYVERVRGTFAGRLNGRDFALCLPMIGMGAETAASVHGALVAAPAISSAGVELAVGAVDGLRGVSVSAALAAADAALAQAEAGNGLHVENMPGEMPQQAGSRIWREQIGAALSEGRAHLAQYPVLDKQGRLIRWECPLRVQLQPGQDYQPAGRWLALARRSRLMPQVDLMALELAMQAIQIDGQPRSVHVSWPSLAAPGFVAQVTQSLQEAPAAARKLSIEWVESMRPKGWQVLAGATQPWRSLGAKMGVEHAGAAPQQLMQLHELGIDYIKIDPRHLRGVASDSATRAFAQSLVALVHGLNLQAVAEGVSHAADLQALWAIGFDAATGPAVTELMPSPPSVTASAP